MSVDVLQRRKAQLTAQYNLDNLNSKISALSSKDLDKYEWLTNTHLGKRPSNLDNMKFEYSPLGSTINKVLIKKIR